MRQSILTATVSTLTLVNDNFDNLLLCQDLLSLNDFLACYKSQLKTNKIQFLYQRYQRDISEFINYLSGHQLLTLLNYLNQKLI